MRQYVRWWINAVKYTLFHAQRPINKPFILRVYSHREVVWYVSTVMLLWTKQFKKYEIWAVFIVHLSYTTWNGFESKSLLQLPIKSCLSGTKFLPCELVGSADSDIWSVYSKSCISFPKSCPCLWGQIHRFPCLNVYFAPYLRSKFRKFFTIFF